MKPLTRDFYCQILLLLAIHLSLWRTGASYDIVEDTFKDIQVIAEDSKDFSKNKTFQALPLDPAVYYGKLQVPIYLPTLSSSKTVT